jgi:outer membrane receptor for ferric coprogen and ferric-rhodotorulic acid
MLEHRYRQKPLTLATRRALFSLALAAAAPAFAAQAADAGSPTTAGAARNHQIAAGPLSSALNLFAAEAGVALSFDPALAAGRHSPGLRGRYTPASGFAALLAGTGLEAIDQGNRGYSLRRLAATPADGEKTLATISVAAEHDGKNITEGSGSYGTPSMATATRLGLSTRETPQSVSVITRQQMDDQALNSVPDILEKAVGVTVGRNDSERATFYARGYTIDNFQFDGVPNTLDSSNQYTTAIGDSAIYDRVEVVRGAAGLLTGAGNPSATINLVRKLPTSELAASLSTSVGSWNKYRAVGDVSGPLNASGSVRGRVVLAAQNAGSYIDYYQRDTRSAYAIVEADLGPNTLLTAGIDYMRSRADGATFGHIPLFYSDGTQTHFRRSLNPGARWSYWDNNSANSFASLKHAFGDGWKLDLAASHLKQSKEVEYGSAYNGSVDRASGAGVKLLAGILPTQANTDSANLAINGPFSLFGREHQLMLGAGYSRAVKDAQLYTSPALIPVPNYFEWDGYLAQPASYPKRSDRETTITEKGLSLATRLRPTDRLSLILGGRVSWYKLYDFQVSVAGVRAVADNIAIDEKFVPYAGVVFDLDRTWSVYASYTDIFRPQTYYKDANDNPMQPLTGKNAEAGIKGEFFERRLNAGVALFRTEQNNSPQYVGVNSRTGGEIYRAIEGVTSKGVEAELAGQITPAWNVAGGYTFRMSHIPPQPDLILSAVNTNQPKHLFKMSTSYHLPGDLNKLVVGGSLTWQSETYYQTADARRWRATQPSYAVLGLMARYTVNPRLSVSLNLNNVLDKTYMPGMGSYGTGVYGDPRGALLTANVKF